MLVSNIESKSNDVYCELTAKIETDALKEPFSLWYRFPAHQKQFIDHENGDPFLAVSLLPAMKLREPLQVTAPVSQRLLNSARKLQAIYHGWDQTLSEIPMTAPVPSEESSQVNKESNVGLFFSLGVDSFYTLLKNSTAHPSDQDAITHLISLHGFDIYYGRGNTAVFADVVRTSTKVAETLNKKTLPVATNLRDFSDQFVTWGRLYHGAALASVGLALRHMFKTIHIAATYSYQQLFPWGSHPLLDPLWSTESLRFVHNGGEAGRLDKIRFIAQFPIAMETLRTCYRNPNNEYNCGCCEKCLRTMIGLHIARALRKCKTFPKQIDLETLQNLSIAQNERPWAQELLDNLGSSTLDLAIGTTLRQALSRTSSRVKESGEEGVESELHEIAPTRVGNRRANNRGLNSLEANDMRTRIRAYCMERVRSPDKIESRGWKQIVTFLRRFGFGDGTLCGMCQFLCYMRSFTESLSCLTIICRRSLFSFTLMFRERFLPIGGNVVCVIENEP